MLNERTAQKMDEIERLTEDPADALREVLTAAIIADPVDARIWLGHLAATLSDQELAAVHVAANRLFLATVRRLVSRINPALSEADAETTTVGVVSVVTGVCLLATADPIRYSTTQMRHLIDASVRAVSAGAFAFR